MRKYQFTVCVILDNGFVMPIERLITPIVEANSFQEATESQVIMDYCTEYKCRIFREVGR